MNNGAKLPKRTLGASGGCCAVAGNPAPNSDGLIVVEGLADGLALAARREQTIMVTCTTPRASGPVLEYAATWASVQLHGDKDGPGQVAAAKLKGALLARGVTVESLIFDGFEDAAVRTPKRATSPWRTCRGPTPPTLPLCPPTGKPRASRSMKPSGGPPYAASRRTLRVRRP